MSCTEKKSIKDLRTSTERARQHLMGYICRWALNEKTGAHEWEPFMSAYKAALVWARLPIEQRPMNRHARRRLEVGHVRLIAPPQLLSQDPNDVLQRDEDRRYARNRRKAAERRARA